MSDVITENEFTVEQIEKILELVKRMVAGGVISRDRVMATVGIRGRKAPPLPTFTFPGSGIEVQIRRLGPFTLDEIRANLAKSRRPPPAPVVRVPDEYNAAGDVTKWRMEENPADPKYKEDLVKYEEELTEKQGRLTIDTIVNYAVVVDVDPEEVRATREFLGRVGVDKEKLESMSDHEIYVKHVCVVTGNDLTELQNFVVGESVPTEERVQAHEDSFPGNVPEEANS